MAAVSSTAGRGMSVKGEPWIVHQGHVLDVLATLPAASVHCVVTSPPYWGLRDYKLPLITWPDGWTGHLGLEPTVEQWVAHLVEVFRAVRRVLRADGVCWVNLGDSYAGAGYSNHANTGGCQREHGGKKKITRAYGLKPLDLIGQPWMLAFALQQPYYAGRIKDENDRRWMAAMIDTEGCIHVHRRPAGQKAYSNFTRKDGTEAEYVRTQDTFGVMVSIDNTSKPLISRCQEIVGRGSFYTHEAGTGKSNRKRTLYRWTVTGDQARELIQETYPYLVAKQREARIAFWSASSGDAALRSHAVIKRLHNGLDIEEDAKAPPSLYEPGWYLRSDVIWGKPNPMPESVAGWRWERCRVKVKHGIRHSGGTRGNSAGTFEPSLHTLDRYATWSPCPGCSKCASNAGLVLRRGAWRPTKAHEYLFLLAKSPDYFCDGEAVKELSSDNTHSRGPAYHDLPKTQEPGTGVRGNSSWEAATWGQVSSRNLRSVWTIPTQPFPGAHFATFPEALVAPCIKAGTSERGVCATCGAPWAREVNVESDAPRRQARGKALTSPRQDGSAWNENDGRGFMPIAVTSL